MHPNVSFHIVGARRTLWKLKATAFIGNGVVTRHDPVLLHAKNISEGIRVAHLHKPAFLRHLRRSGKAIIVHGKIDLADIAIGYSISVMPNSRNSFGRRSCKVPNARSLRPRASGEYAGICSIPSCESARPTWVNRCLSTASPTFGVRK